MSSESNTTNYKSFHYLENGSVEFSILNTKFTKNKLNIGIYDIEAIPTNSGCKIELKMANCDENFDRDVDFYFEDKINNIYASFFNPEVKSMVNLLGYNHKLGLLLHGKAGTGKTSMLKKYFNSIVKEQNGIVFNLIGFNYLPSTWDFIREIRKIQDNPIVIFIDEFEELVDPNGIWKKEATFKKMSDGFDSIDNCFFMLATNYIDKIPTTIKDRPSRVKYCIEVSGIESEDKIRKFLNDSFKKINLEIDFEKDVSSLKGYTLDELKRYVLDKIMNITNETFTKKTIGFNNKK